MPILFHRTRELVARIEEFLDAVSEGVLVFKAGVDDYVSGRSERFAERYAEVHALENKADDLRRDIEQNLYAHSLIPESRGDVLGLLETMDDVIDTAKNTLALFLVERPVIPPEQADTWIELAVTATHTAEAVVLAARAFFRDPTTVKDHLHKVYFHEKEGDRLALELGKRIFASDLELAAKIHLRSFATQIDMVSDAAEDVADRITIYAIKRTV